MLEEHSDKAKGFTYPHWGEIAEIAEKEWSDSLNTFYEELSREWMLSIKNNLAGDFELNETRDFLILSNENTHTTKNLAYHCERSLKLILDQFGGSIDDSGFGKHVLIVFETMEQYDNYTSYFMGDGATPVSSGLCIYQGYIHIILPIITNDESPIAPIAHELSHALLAEYQVPNWIDEAVAMRIEDIAVGYDGLSLTRESYKLHQKHWNEESIQKFWSGEAWYGASVAFDLSYELARILWKKIAVDLHATKEEIVEFIKTLNYNDSGNAAFKSIFDHSLGDLVEDFLGEGNWEPDEDYLLSRSKAYDEAPNWYEGLKPLAGLNEEELLLCPISKINPSHELSSLFAKLNVETLGDYLKLSTETVFLNREDIKRCDDELSVKLGVLELTTQSDETLLDISYLFSIFRDGIITSGYLDIKKCSLIIEIKYLAEMIDPSFKQFKIEIENFGGYEFETVQKNKGVEIESVSFDKMMNMNLEISGAKIDIGKILIYCSNDKADPTEGEFIFHGSAAKVFDESGKEWSLDDLEKLADEYWEGS